MSNVVESMPEEFRTVFVDVLGEHDAALLSTLRTQDNPPQNNEKRWTTFSPMRSSASSALDMSQQSAANASNAPSRNSGIDGPTTPVSITPAHLH